MPELFQQEYKRIESNVAELVAEMERSINEANAFMSAMSN